MCLTNGLTEIIFARFNFFPDNIYSEITRYHTTGSIKVVGLIAGLRNLVMDVSVSNWHCRYQLPTQNTGKCTLILSNKTNMCWETISQILINY